MMFICTQLCMACCKTSSLIGSGTFFAGVDSSQSDSQADVRRFNGKGRTASHFVNTFRHTSLAANEFVIKVASL
jgi:hypothetical protein